jgi:hypothetical protein
MRWGYTHKQRRGDKTVGTKFFAFQEYPLSSMNFKKNGITSISMDLKMNATVKIFSRWSIQHDSSVLLHLTSFKIKQKQQKQ